MTTTHIDQLTEWYESAERITKTNRPRSGDCIISPSHTGAGYHITLEPDDWTADIVHGDRERARILARAPKPKPAWHDAKAVIASVAYCERQVWERGPLGWHGTAGDAADTEDLRDVTPLIEAKVTDEMVQRGAQARTPSGVRYLRPHEVRAVLTAALTEPPPTPEPTLEELATNMACVVARWGYTIPKETDR